MGRLRSITVGRMLLNNGGEKPSTHDAGQRHGNRPWQLYGQKCGRASGTDQRIACPRRQPPGRAMMAEQWSSLGRTAYESGADRRPASVLAPRRRQRICRPLVPKALRTNGGTPPERAQDRFISIAMRCVFRQGLGPMA